MKKKSIITGFVLSLRNIEGMVMLLCAIIQETLVFIRITCHDTQKCFIACPFFLVFTYASCYVFYFYGKKLKND